MQTGRRIPKRSILGSRVSVECEDGVWRPANVTAMRPAGLFELRLAGGAGRVVVAGEGELVGPGFLSCLPPFTKLLPGQRVWVTHSGREVQGEVALHHTDQVTQT